GSDSSIVTGTASLPWQSALSRPLGAASTVMITRSDSYTITGSRSSPVTPDAHPRRVTPTSRRVLSTPISLALRSCQVAGSPPSRDGAALGIGAADGDALTEGVPEHPLRVAAMTRAT